MAAITRFVGGLGYAGRLLGSFAGKIATAATSAVGRVRTRGKGSRKQHFIELDGRIIVGAEPYLQGLLRERRASAPVPDVAKPARAALAATTAAAGPLLPAPRPAPAGPDPELVARAQAVADALASALVAERLAEQRRIAAAEEERMRRMLDDEEAILVLTLA